MSSMLFKLIEKTDKAITALNSAIDKRSEAATKLQYEQLLLLEEIFEQMLPEEQIA